MARTAAWVGVLVLVAPLLGGAQGGVSFYLHGTGPNNNPPTVFLDATVPVESTAKFKDSTGLNFNGGNPWTEIGTWPAAPQLTSGSLTSLGSLRVWLGLKNSDDQGTRFDLRAEVQRNGIPVATGETYCITGVTRNPSNAKEVAVSFTPFAAQDFDGTTHVLSLKVFARIGTDGAGGFCGGHSNAVGARLYFDAVTRPASFNATFAPLGGGEPPVVHLDDQVEVATSSRVTLTSESHDPGSLPLTFAWTQLEGPTVALEGAGTPNVGFISPADDAELVLRLTVSNGLASASRDVTIRVIGFATDLGLQPGSGEGHTSALEVTSTSLRPGFIWGRADTALEVSLSAADGAVLVDVIDPIEPFGVLLLHATGAEEVTDLFLYSTADNQVSLDPTRVADFRALVKDHPMELLITGGDSAGNGAELYVPLFNGRFQILGTATLAAGATPEPLVGTLVTLRGLNLGLTATITLDADGLFVFDNLPGDTYRVEILTPGGLFGIAFALLEEAPGDTVSISVELFGPDATPTPLSAAGSIAATLETGFPLARQRRLGRTLLSAEPVQADTLASQSTLLVPQGTQAVTLAYRLAGSGGFDACFFLPFTHPCDCPFLARQPAWAIHFLLNQQVIWSASNLQCATALRAAQDPNGSHPYDSELFVRNIDVSQATKEADGVLRLVVVDADLIDVLPSAEIGPAFALTRVFDLSGGTTLPRVTCGNSQKKFLGVPRGGKETVNKWNVGIKYEPADAEILNIRAVVEAPGLPDQDLFFRQPPDIVPGLIALRDVAFPFLPNPRPLWELKGEEVKIAVEIEAEVGGIQVLRRALLGTEVHVRKTVERLTPLYDAGELVPDTQRYGPREAGGDGWGTMGTFDLLTAFEFPPTEGDPTPEKFVFNDVSLEHGGSFPPHDRHQCGVSIDTRYFGAGGGINLLNGAPADRQEDQDLGLVRRERLREAQNGNAQAQEEIVDWILSNRRRIEALADNPEVCRVLIGVAVWNRTSLIQGRYENGASIIDPRNSQSVGGWASSPPKLGFDTRHLDHVHIERCR